MLEACQKSHNSYKAIGTSREGPKFHHQTLHLIMTKKGSVPQD